MIVDDIRSMTLFDFRKPLESHLMKNSTEWLALLIVSQCKTDFPKFLCNDAPDLQSRDNQIGIEVTEAISKEDAQISGLFSSYRNGKCRTDKWKDIVEKNGGKVAFDGSNITYPTIFEFNGYGHLIGYKKIEEMDLLKKCARLLAEKKIEIESIEKEL